MPYPSNAAVTPQEQLTDPALEARARALFYEIRCPVCDSQNIDGSDADVAKDLRVLVRERIAAGDTDQAILDKLQSQYGDIILMTPPMRGATYILWFGPFALLAIGALATLVHITKAARS